MLENIRDGFIMSEGVKSCCVLKSSVNEAKGMTLTIEQGFSHLSQPSPKLPEETETQVMGESLFPLKESEDSGKHYFGFCLQGRASIYKGGLCSPFFFFPQHLICIQDGVRELKEEDSLLSS